MEKNKREIEKEKVRIERELLKEKLHDVSYLFIKGCLEMCFRSTHLQVWQTMGHPLIRRTNFFSVFGKTFMLYTLNSVRYYKSWLRLEWFAAWMLTWLTGI